MLFRSVICKLLLFVFLPLQAAEKATPAFKQDGLELYGELTQGAMITGQAPDAKKLSVFSREVFLSPEGKFVFGIGRDAPETVQLDIVWQSGKQETLDIPIKQREYDIQRIEGVEDKYVREPDPELLKRIRKEAGMVREARQNLRPEADFLVGFQWPAEGPITGVYGSQRVFNGVPKRPHYGLDIAGPVGTPVYAPASGKVTLAHESLYYSGGTLILDHGQGISSTFIHLNKIHVNEGEYIKAGAHIADMGATGRVTGPHLDWRINWFDQRLDPALVLPSRESEPESAQE